jgi:hypothetical protein
MSYPAITIGQAVQQVLVDLGSFVSYHSPSTRWMVTVDWGDGTSSRKQVAVDGGLGAWPHTYATAGNYAVTVTLEDGWLQTAHHDITVSIA